MKIEEILDAHGPMINRIVASYEADPALRQELLQDVLLGIWRALPKLKERERLKAYVARVAQNICLTHVKKAIRAPKSVELAIDMPSEQEGPEEITLKGQRRRVLEDAVRALPLSLKPVVTLALEGFDYNEIAASLGITENNAMVRFSRAKTELKKKMRRSEAEA